jgi:steroid delta-isomerase-like uncharacterized protein
MGNNEAVLRSYLQAIDDHDLGRIREVLDADIDVVAPGVEFHGIDQVAGWLQVFLTAFPDLRHDVRSVLEVDGRCAAEVRFSGTHTGPLASPQGEIPATGKPFAFDYVQVSSLEQGRIRNDHIYFDQLGFLGQLGLLPG